MPSERKSPMFLAEEVNEGTQMRFWCPYCQYYHYHGIPPRDRGSRKVTHRVSHCAERDIYGRPIDSPLTGYYLKVAPKRKRKSK